MYADKVIRNGYIWTANRINPEASAVAVKDKKIIYVGDDWEANGLIGDDTEIIDLGGRMMMPSFIDSHTHTTMMINSSWIEPFDFEKCETMDDVMKMVVNKIGDKTPEEYPYVYADPVPTELIEREKADRKIIDKYVNDRPVLLGDTSFHQCIVNSKMLELMEITKDTPYNEEGAANYLRYADGEPNGVILERLHEFNGDILKMYNKLGWMPPSADIPENARMVYKPCTDFGICAIAEGWTENEKTLIGLKKLIDVGEYPGYFSALPKFTNVDDLEDCIATLKEWKKEYGSDYMIFDTVKFFLDGTNEVGTGSYIEPVVNDPENYGEINISEEELTYVIKRLNEECISLQLHIVGDNAYRMALNAVDNVKKTMADPDEEFKIRVTLLHCELIHPDDIPRAAQKGVFVNVTPGFAAGIFGDAARNFLGEERFNSMFSYNDIIVAGGCVNFSADNVDFYSLEEQNPILQIGYGVTRSIPQMNIYGRPKDESRLSLYDMMMGYTINNAKGLGIEDKTGSFEAGKMANMIVLNKNIFEVSNEEIFGIIPEQIYFEGERIL